MFLAQKRENTECYKEENKNHPNFHNIQIIIIKISINAYVYACLYISIYNVYVYVYKYIIRSIIFASHGSHLKLLKSIFQWHSMFIFHEHPHRPYSAPGTILSASQALILTGGL